MGLFDRAAPGPDPNPIGRQHNVLAELHYEDGKDDWWWQGRLVVEEAGTVEAEWDPNRRRWIFRPETAQGSARVEWAATADMVSEMRPRSRRVRMPHRIYYFGDVAKADRRYFHTVDLDLIQSAPQVPYHRTDKGARRFNAIAMATMMGVELLTLAVLVSILSSAAAVPSAPPSFGSGILLDLVQAIGWPASILAVYWYVGRRTQVLSMDLRPVAQRVGSPRNELVYITNSHKEPAARYLRRLFGLPSAAIEADSLVVGRFQSETIERLQEALGFKDEQLDKYKLTGSRDSEQRMDLAILSATTGGVRPMNWTLVALLVLLSVVGSAVATAAILLAGA